VTILKRGLQSLRVKSHPMRQLSKQQLSKLKIKQQYLRLDKKIAEKEFFKYFNLIHNPSFAQTSVGIVSVRIDDEKKD
jgi:hypothetical protein